MNKDHQFSPEEICEVLALSNDATAIYTGEQLTIQMANDAMINFWGKDRYVIGKTFEEAVPELVGQPFFELLLKVWHTGIDYTATDTAAQLMVNGQPQWFYYDFEYRAIKDRNGRVYCILHTARDVTSHHISRQAVLDGERREQNLVEELSATNEELSAANEEISASNEELLKYQQDLQGLNHQLEKRVTDRTDEFLAAKIEADTQRDRLERFFMQAPAGICMLDGPELVFEMINPLYQQFFPTRDLLGKPLLTCMPELKGQPIIDIIYHVYRTGETFTGNEMLIPLARTLDGPFEDRYFNFIYQARIAVDGRINGVILFAIEVTDMTLAKQKQQQNAEKFRTQLNAIPQIAWTISLDGTIDFYNEKWYNYTGLTAEQTSSEGWHEIIHPDDLQHTQDKVAAILTSAIGGEFETREKRADGGYRWHLVRIVPIKNGTGMIQSWIGTATDIHDLKVVQEQKDDFISIASHELKTPVTSLKASLQLLDRMKANPSAVMLPKLIEQANKSVEKITELIEDLLDASKLNESQLHINRKKFNVSEMLEGCCNHVRAAGNHELEFQGDRTLTIFADEHRIDQVVVNFVNNAVKYAPDSKKISLIVEKTDHHIKVLIRDYGPGIAPDKIPHLFNKYYRAEYSGAQYSGLGLGLYISSEIIKRHNGQIGVDSKLGEGSSFWFTLPS